MRRHAAKAAYEAAWQAAWELDQSRWKAFDEDKAANAAFEAEYVIPVIVEPVTAVVEESSGGSLWATWDNFVVTQRDHRLSLTLNHDGKYLDVAFTSPLGDYRFASSYQNHLIIGKCRGSPTAAQRQAAAMVGAIQAQGKLTGQVPVVVFEDYWQLRHKHYARYAAARGWPAEKGAEADRVDREYRAARV
jgi:hypothetical protein